MSMSADFRLEEAEGTCHIIATGDWTLVDLGEAGKRLIEAVQAAPNAVLDLSEVERFDTAGALAIVRAFEGGLESERVKGKTSSLHLLTLVADAAALEKPKPQVSRPFHALIERVGRGVYSIGNDIHATLAFNGRLLVAIGRATANPKRVRWAACFSLIERAGLDAMPIVAVTTFFIGAVIALLGANMLSQFGAQVFVVELIGIAVLREFNVIITSVLLAGRSASSFAAEIGSMKMSQEIDAMRVLGIDPFDALVIPRFFALLFSIPLLTFVATLAGLLGGLLVTWSVLDLGPTFFLQRIVENVGISHFWIGMSKAPIMAAVIASIGCRQGMEVGGDVESLGRRVTAAVVQSIFSLILIDAVFALIYMELDL
jgi:phospholipid/cholesterol/gamma-HCH transport system permease protein